MTGGDRDADVPGDAARSDRCGTMNFAGTPESVADRLSLFLESPHNLKKHLAKHRGLSPTDEQAKSVCACLHQAREFLRIARRVDMAIRPVVTYYGMNSMAKALVVASGRVPSLEELKPGHGLSAPTRFGQPLSEEVVSVWKTPANLFQHLVDALATRSSLRIPVRGGGALNVRCSTSTSAEVGGLTASLKELLARIPGLGNFFSATFGEAPLLTRARYLASEWAPDTYQVSLIVKDIDEDSERSGQMYGIHPLLKRWRLMDRRGSELVFENLDPDIAERPRDQEGQLRVLIPIEDIAIPVSAGPDGEGVIVGSLHGVSLATPILLYLTAFLLSSIARYRPDTWAGVAGLDRTERDSGIRAILEDFYELVLSRFPIIILSSLAHTRLVVWDGQVKRVYDW